MKVLSLLSIFAFALLCIECSVKGGKAKSNKSNEKAERKNRKKEVNNKIREVMGGKSKPSPSPSFATANKDNASPIDATIDGGDGVKESDKPVWLREAEAMDILHEMGIIEEGPVNEHPEITYVQFYTFKFEQLKTKVDLEELDRFAIEHYNSLKESAGKKEPKSASSVSSVSSVSPMSPSPSLSPISPSPSLSSVSSLSPSSPPPNNTTTTTTTTTPSNGGKNNGNNGNINGKSIGNGNNGSSSNINGNGNNGKNNGKNNGNDNNGKNNGNGNNGSSSKNNGKNNGKAATNGNGQQPQPIIPTSPAVISSTSKTSIDAPSPLSSSPAETKLQAPSPAEPKPSPAEPKPLPATPKLQAPSPAALARINFAVAKGSRRTESAPSVPEIKENYLPVYLAMYAEPKVKEAFARHLDPLFKGDLAQRAMPAALSNDQRLMLGFHEALVRAMGPEREETRQFVRAEFAYPSDLKESAVKEFAQTRMDAYMHTMKAFTRHLREHLEGISPAHHERMAKTATAMIDMHNGAFKSVNNGANYPGFLEAHADLVKYLRPSHFLLADVLVPMVKMSPTAAVDELEGAPSNLLPELAEWREALPDLESCLTALGAGGLHFAVIDAIRKWAETGLSTTTDAPDLSQLPAQAKAVIDAVLLDLKDNYGCYNPDNLNAHIYDVLQKTLIAWMAGWMAVAAIGKPHIVRSMSDAYAYDLDYYQSLLQFAKSTRGALFASCLEAIRLKIYGDSMAIAFNSVNEVGGMIDDASAVQTILARFLQAHSNDSAMVELFNKH